MEETKSRPVYQPPMSVDLFEQGVRGAKPLATCTGGSNPKNSCSLGNAYLAAHCRAGNSDAQKCSQGSGVISRCSAGTTV